MLLVIFPEIDATESAALERKGGESPPWIKEDLS